MKRDGDIITLSMNESREIVKNVTIMYDDVPRNVRDTKYCCGFFDVFNLFKKLVEEK